MQSLMRTLLWFAVPALFGCGSTAIHESHILQARDANHNCAYYRVTIKGDAKLAKTNYRAGFYDAEAVDAVIGGVDQNDPTSIDQVLARKRSGGVEAIAARYYKELLENPDSEQVSQWAGRLDTALHSTRFAPLRKYIVIFSALASVVEEAIASFSEEKDTRDLVMSLVAPSKREAFINAKVDREALERGLRVVSQARRDADAMTAPKTAAEKAAMSDRLKRILSDLASLDVE